MNIKRLATISLVITGLLVFFSGVSEASSGDLHPAYEKNAATGVKADQYAVFPTPLPLYEQQEGGLWANLKYRAMDHGGFNLVATLIFLFAIIHTFVAGYFAEMAHHHEEKHREMIKVKGRRAVDKPEDDAVDDVSFKANLLHFLGEVEVVFGIWIIALAAAVLYFFGIQGESIGAGVEQVKLYLGHDVNYTEPIFVVIIMGIAATRPVIRFAEKIVGMVAKKFGDSPASFWFSALTITPLLGSLITEPAAMTIAAMLLGRKFFEMKPSVKFSYATLGLLFVNISVGGTLTHFAAPPVLMIAEPWDWGMSFMMSNYGWKAVIGILLANSLYFMIFRKEFASLSLDSGDRDMHMPLRWEEREDPIPVWVTLVHIGFLAWTVYFLHVPTLFIGGFLFLLAFTQATGHHQNDVSMKTPILVGFFLAALVIHGRCQAWWIDAALTWLNAEFEPAVSSWLLMIGSTTLTAFNDNAAITFLASQASDLPQTAKYAILAGAVTGGGLTVIANAPNPAGQSILGRHFKGGVSPLSLLKGALIPTIIMGACFMFLPSKGMTVAVKSSHGPDHAEHGDHSHGDATAEDHH